MLVAAIDWTMVLDTAILTVPAIIAALYARSVHLQVKTPSGRSIGRQVEDTLHTTISNYHYANAISDKVGAEPAPAANGEASKVDAIK